MSAVVIGGQGRGQLPHERRYGHAQEEEIGECIECCILWLISEVDTFEQDYRLQGGQDQQLQNGDCQAGDRAHSGDDTKQVVEGRPVQTVGPSAVCPSASLENMVNTYIHINIVSVLICYYSVLLI